MNTKLHFIAIGVLTILGLSVQAGAVVYSPPPSWSPMSMLDLTYNTTTRRIEMVDQSTKMGAGVYAVLAIDTYLNLSVTSGATGYARPNNDATTFGSFDPTKPWSVLNGTAFSRRIGWNPGGAIKADIEEAYGDGASIWVECLSKSPGLESYLAVGKYGVKFSGTTSDAGLLDAAGVPIIEPADNGYSGIFGTAGSSTKWQWDYLMDHNTYAVSSQYLTSPGLLFSATYRVYVGDSQGNEIFNPDQSSASTIETWTWQGPANVPEPATIALWTTAWAWTMARRRRR